MTSGRLALIRSFILFRTIFFLLLCFRVSLEFWCLYEGANILIEWLLSYDWLLLTSCKILVTWNFRWDLVHTSSLTLSTRTLIAGTTNRVYCLLKVTTNWGYWTWLHLKLFLREKREWILAFQCITLPCCLHVPNPLPFFRMPYLWEFYFKLNCVSAIFVHSFRLATTGCWFELRWSFISILSCLFDLQE